VPAAKLVGVMSSKRCKISFIKASAWPPPEVTGRA
jgi:hypothetical protein